MSENSPGRRKGPDRGAIGGALGALIGVPVWDHFGIVAGLAAAAVLGVGLRVVFARTARV